MQGDVVETSDAEEEEEIRAAKYIYWKKEAKHEISDRNDVNSPKKRLKLGHFYGVDFETPRSRSSSSPQLSSFLSSSQPLLDPITSSPCILLSNTPKSRSLVPRPHSNPLYASSVQDDSHDFDDDIPFHNIPQDPLLLGPQTSPDVLKLESGVTETSLSSMPSTYSDDSEPRSCRPLALPVCGTLSVDPHSLFGSPSSLSDVELPDTAVPTTPDVEILSPSARLLLSPHSPISLPPPSVSIFANRSILNIPPSPLTPPSDIDNYDPLFDSSPLHNIASITEKNHDGDVDTPSELGVAHIPDQPRYSLRRRGANQLKPYTIENLQYKKALSSNPDAMVKFRSPTRGVRHRSNGTNEDSQEHWEPHTPDENELWEAPQWSRFKKDLQAGPSRIPALGISNEDAGPPMQYSEFLQDLPTTDEEEAKEMKALSKEARKAARERKAREVKEKTHKKKPKSFPLPNGHVITNNLPSRTRGRYSETDVYTSKTELELPPRSASQEKQLDRPLTPSFISNIPSGLHSGSQTELFDQGDWVDLSSERSNIPHNNFMNNVESASEVENGGTNGEYAQRSVSNSGHESDSDPAYDPLDRKRMKVLGRMVPAFMLKHLAKDSTTSKPARKRQPSMTIVSGSDNDSDEEPEIKPGKTRTRWTKQIKGNAEIKGDTESSDEQSSITDSGIEGMVGEHRPASKTSQGRISTEVIVISDSSEDVQDSSDEGVDDETIQAYLDGKMVTKKPRRTGHRAEESLIDWMLSRAQTIGGPKKVKTKKQPLSNIRRRQASSQTKYKMDVITNRGRGMGRERQSKIDFGHQSGFAGRKQPPYQKSASGGDGFGHFRDETPVDSFPQKKTRKEKEKERQVRAKANGVYTFGSNDTQVVTGRRAKGMVTIDIEEDDFNAGPAWCYALPLSNQVASMNPKSPNGLKKLSWPLHTGIIHKPAFHEQELKSYGAATKPPRRKIKRPGDFGVPLLHSGICFATTTFVGKGGLRELCEILSPTTALPTPIATIIHGIEVGPSTSLDDFVGVLRGVLKGLLDFATGLPTLDSTEEAKEWSDSTRVCCQYLSWQLSTWGEKECNNLRGVVQESVLESVFQMQELCLEAHTLDLSTFSLCWFMVELSARLGQTIQHQRPNSLSEAVTLLIHHLLQFDIEKTMTPVCNGSLLDSSTTAGYTAELWVCLFHVLDTHYRMVPDAKQTHPFWVVFQRGLESASSPMNPLAASENIWKGIFSLCALTQFSVHGMTMAKSRLPANWELVVIALKKVSLNPNPVSDVMQPNSQLNKRDIYANLAVRRCVDLSHRWEWSLEQSSNLFNQLADIFRSRKFANLRHETPDYPLFMRNNKWDLNLDYRRGDSAFILFLRLLVKAADYDPMNPTRTPSPRAKKLLSLAIPVGSLAFSKSRPTAIRDLSMLSVRLAAIAVGIHVDPTSHASRIAHARTYVDFSDADDTTRKAVIRGIQYLAALMVTWRVPLGVIADWIRAVAGELVDELRDIPKTNDNLIKRNGLSITVQLLVGCVRHIVGTHQTCSEYPEPALLSSLVRIFFISSLATEAKTLDELRFLIEAMLDARALVVPPPERPRLAPTPNTEIQESQDDYGEFDLDFDDPALLAALGDAQPLSVEQPDLAGKEERMRQAIKTTQSHYLAWRSLNAFVKNAQEHKGDREYFGIVNSWIYCWVGATLMTLDSSSERVSGKIFKLWDPFREALQRDILDRRQRRVDLTVMLCLLKLEPMSYLEIQDRYLKVLMNSLIAMEVDLDCEYISLLLSVDGLRHPLLVGVPCERESEAVDFKVMAGEFEAVSLDILQTILVNLARLCDDISSDRDKYLDLVKGMLSTMRRLSMDERWKSRPGYIDRCRRVVRMVSEHLGDRLPGLAFFVDWERSLV
ncbi:Mus7/MMS22 family-domain-containing protein [Collybia nuda]|uniref:Mus7/MMS22 family-domain-containing protein n=1 Tax=Collybia nuda TaxID=64659 RepID=A0A9P6CJL2_9AGAR|nr:Mus7/MMS22 family-domain-containing protein [Collybia nuda]